MGLLQKLFGANPPDPTPPDGDGESPEVVASRNAEVRSVIDDVIDEWQEDFQRLTQGRRTGVGPAEALRQARRKGRYFPMADMVRGNDP